MKYLSVVLAGALLGGALAAPPAAAAQLQVVTSTTDLADIAKTVGGTRVRVQHIAEGYQDPHYVEAKPSYVLQMRKADVFAYVGLDLEVGWMSLLIEGSRNPKIQRGATGHLDVSTAIPVLDIPQGRVDRSQGDVHPLGNPHYWLHPDNAKRIAVMFATTFSRLDARNAAFYQRNAADFARRLDAAQREWKPLLDRIDGKPVVAWHTSWRYFAEYTGMNIVGFVEPKPGVPPSAQHLAALIQTMRRTGAKTIIMEPFYDRKIADRVAAMTGAQVLVLPPSVGGEKGYDSYLELMRRNITRLASAVS